MNVIIRDGLFSFLEVRSALDWWPRADWPGWFAYDPAYECKRASDLTTPLPAACGMLLARLAELPVDGWFPDLAPLIPDLAAWGGGLHEMPPGAGLGLHRDADTHKRLGLARVLSAVLWVHDEWLLEWGGFLTFASGASVAPMPGRLCVFDCREELHQVSAVTCPEGVCRRALALFWYSPTKGNGARPRAVFAGHEERG